MRNIGVIILLAVLAVSCKKDEYDIHERSNVLLVYIGADNNLQTVAHSKLNGICDGWSGTKTDKIVVYFDYKGAPAELKEIMFDESGKKTAVTIAKYNRENSASATTLSRVISDVKRVYSADNYGLLVFSHASGWLPEGTLNNPFMATTEVMHSRSIILDDSFGEMEILDFASAIPDGMFDYIVFEACFMAGIEVAYELRNKTPYILASSAEIVDPGFTPIYSTAISELLSGNVRGFGQNAYGHVMTYSENNVQRSATFSVIRTAELEQLTGFIRDNCDFHRDIEISAIQHFDRSVYRLFFDFEDYYSRLLSTDLQRTELARLIDNCVTWKAATEQFMTQWGSYQGYAIERHSGMTTFISQPEFPKLNIEYKKLNWTKAIKSDKI